MTTKNTLKFKIGDKVVANNRRDYNITSKGNGHGIVKKVYSATGEIRIEWYSPDGHKGNIWNVKSEGF